MRKVASSIRSEAWARNPDDASFVLRLRFLTARKKLIKQVRPPIDLNHVANSQFAASSGFRLAVHLNFATLDHQLCLSARVCNATELQELIQSQGFTFGSGIG
jgi:hypothetical protein